MLRLFIPYIFTILSAILFALSFWFQSLSWVIWFALAPWLYVMSIQSSLRSVLRHSSLFGISVGTGIFLWVFDANSNVDGGSIWMALFGYVFFSLIYSVIPILFSVVVYYIKKRRRTSSELVNILLVPSIWVVVEYSHLSLLHSLPWTQVFPGYALSYNLYAIQITSITGIWGLSFIITLVNNLICYTFDRKSIKYSAYAIGTLLLLHLFGWLTLRSFDASTRSQSLSVSIIQENFNGLTKWSKETGDSLAGVFLSLHKEAIKYEPDMILWSESSLPWALTPDDDLISESLMITESVQADHVIGISVNHAEQNNEYYNAAVHIKPDGLIDNMYYKQKLLAFFEKSLLSLNPLNRDSTNKKLVHGTEAGILKSKNILVGVNICSEWLLPKTIRRTVRAGAQVLTAMSNNTYFGNSFMSRMHFGEIRIRAVENRRDVAINSNYGIIGKITSSGHEESLYNIDKSQHMNVELQYTNRKSIYYKLGDWFPLGLFVALIFFSFKLYKR